MQTNLKTAKNCALIALVATVVYIPLSHVIITLVARLSVRFSSSSSHFNMYALLIGMIPAALYYFGMVALLAYLLIYLNNQKEEPANA